MCHHLKTTSTDSVEDFGAFLKVGDLELLLKKDGSLLVG